ncbi:MAG: hypothetical protein N0E48_27175, partial [Candidatus Thiodiazotropha endolucinida]|nr:hypothetical protein [Candidatus Thiodiazotropha taylori]MCW4347008.1 hypothetical protein [Candidatus Thiodiazotropha endolucinida]
MILKPPTHLGTETALRVNPSSREIPAKDIIRMEHVIGRGGGHRLVAPDEGKSYLLDLVKELTGHQLDRPV